MLAPGQQPHAAYARLTAELRAVGLRPGDPTSMPLAAARAANRSYYAFVSGPLPEQAETTDLFIPGPPGPLRLRLHRPSGLGGVLPVIVYFHGGGYALNDLDTHGRLMAELALAAGRAVLGVGYSLAPEHRHPAQLREGLAAMAWLRDHGPAHGLDASEHVLAGDSAGAHLALSLALALRDAGAPMPRSLVLAYGMYQRRGGTPSHALYGDGRYGLTSARMEWFWRHFLPPDGETGPAAAEPLWADLGGLPPVHLLAAEFDCLRDDTVLLAGRLRRAGVPVRLDRHPGMQHSFLQFSRVLPAARHAIHGIAARLRCPRWGDGRTEHVNGNDGGTACGRRYAG